MATIFFASGQSRLPSPGIEGSDKVAHFFAYGLLATLWARALSRSGSGPWRTAITALAIASVYGATDEFHQSFTPGRSVEFADWVADTCGAAVAVAVYCFWRPYRALMDSRLVRSGGGGGQPDAPVVQGVRETNT